MWLVIWGSCDIHYRTKTVTRPSKSPSKSGSKKRRRNVPTVRLVERPHIKPDVRQSTVAKTSHTVVVPNTVPVTPLVTPPLINTVPYTSFPIGISQTPRPPVLVPPHPPMPHQPPPLLPSPTSQYPSIPSVSQSGKPSQEPLPGQPSPLHWYRITLIQLTRYTGFRRLPLEITTCSNWFEGAR